MNREVGVTGRMMCAAGSQRRKWVVWGVLDMWGGWLS